ncbi:hypothetical protein Cfor_00358, partial [Coptotermes formosanus]
FNQQFFLSPEDHLKPLNQRYREFCGQHKVKEVLESSQNSGLIQYRVPGQGKGFSFTVRFPRNPTHKNNCPFNIAACNILLEGKADVYTLRNYRKRVNCSLTTLYPASMKVLSLNVGLQDVEVETGSVRKKLNLMQLSKKSPGCRESKDCGVRPLECEAVLQG